MKQKKGVLFIKPEHTEEYKGVETMLDTALEGSEV